MPRRVTLAVATTERAERAGNMGGKYLENFLGGGNIQGGDGGGALMLRLRDQRERQAPRQSARFQLLKDFLGIRDEHITEPNGQRLRIRNPWQPGHQRQNDFFQKGTGKGIFSGWLGGWLMQRLRDERERHPPRQPTRFQLLPYRRIGSEGLRPPCLVTPMRMSILLISIFTSAGLNPAARACASKGRTF